MIMSIVAVKSLFTRTRAAFESLAGYSGKKEVPLLMIFEWRPARTILGLRFLTVNPPILESEKNEICYNS